MVARHKWSQVMHASIVSEKGNSGEESVSGLKNFITSTGYKRLELKTDGEPALMDVAKKTNEISKVDRAKEPRYL